MNALELWLKQATRHLAKTSTAQVRSEIQQHYELALEAAVKAGASQEEAGNRAVAALGDPVTANCQYRNVLLTSAEARVLREGNWEARAVCSRPWMKAVMVALPGGLLLAAATSLLAGKVELGRELLAGALAMSFLLTAPLLPIYTPRRARTFRFIKWGALTAALLLIFGADAMKWSWLLISCLWPMAWIELTRSSIRRKLRVADWPRHLYL